MTNTHFSYVESTPGGILPILTVLVATLHVLDYDTCIINLFGRPEETAAAVAFHASDDALCVTGACLCVDGGRVGFEIPRE